MSENSEKVAQFCAITGSAAHIAENYLLAHDWDLERAVDFYIDHPPQDEHPPHDPFDEGDQPGPQPAGAPIAQPDVVEIPDDDEENAGLSELAHQRENAMAARQHSQQQMEDMMGAAQDMFRRQGISIPPDMLAVRGYGVAAEAGPSSGPRRGVPSPGAANLMDMDEDAEAVAAAVTGSGQGAALPDEQYGSYHRQQQQQMLDHYHRLAEQRQAAAYQQAATPAAAAADFGQDMGDDPAAAAAAAAAADAEESAQGAAAAGVVADVPLDLPEGINLEEARMLEAAMLGVPYQGRIPDFNAASAAGVFDGVPTSPGAMEQRSLRAEQDAAYEESLALDRAKQESIAAAQAAAEAREQAERAAAEAAATAEANAKQQRAALLELKRQQLANVVEPAAGEPGSFTIVVRLPDGSRKGRRFRATDQLQSVFDFVDVQCSSADHAAATGETGCGGLQPGGYRLVTQFPRQVFIEGTGQSLRDAGITADSALFAELLS